MSELVKAYKWRKEIPRDHKASVDTRIRWLWSQRYGTVQTIAQQSPDAFDRTAAILFFQSVIGSGDLDSISLIFQRLEGGSLVDQEILEEELRNGQQ